MWTVLFLISLAILVPCYAAAIAQLVAHRRIKWLPSPFLLVLISTGIAGYLAYFCMYCDIFSEQNAGIARALAVSVYDTLRLFGLEGDYPSLVNAAAEAGAMLPALMPLYRVFIAVIFVVTPILTLGVVLSFLQDFLAYLRYMRGYFAKKYVFSQLNQKSVALANDLREKYPRAVIVFTNTISNTEDNTSELLESAKDLKAVIFKKDITSVRFGFHCRWKELSFICISETEEDNISDAVSLKDKYDRIGTNMNLYVFSTNAAGEMLLSNHGAEKMRVFRINDARRRVQNFLWEHGEEFFRDEETYPGVGDEVIQKDYLPKKRSEFREINCVIVGLGKYGTELAKALLWYCQMDGYLFSLHIFDKDPDAEKRFTALCPEIMDKSINGKNLNREAYYDVTVHSGINVEGSEFADEIKKLYRTTHVFVMRGNDEDNIRTALQLRTLFEQMTNDINPKIRTVVYNKKLADRLQVATHWRRQKPYRIDFIWGLENSFTEEVLLAPAFEPTALLRHLKYGKLHDVVPELVGCAPTETVRIKARLAREVAREEKRLARQRTGEENEPLPQSDKRRCLDAMTTFWQYEYNYNSSVASTIHRKAKISVFPCTETEPALREEQDLWTLRVMEHSRWNTYMRTEGYVYTQIMDENSRNDLGKKHHFIVGFDLLPEEQKEKDDD